MKRRRTIAAAPVRSAAAAWQVVSTLLADTLERSAAIPAGSVVQQLAPLEGVGPALIAGGHLETRGLVLVDVDLHLTVAVLTADAALSVDENLNPVPGGASATTEWILYLPDAGPLNSSIAVVVKNSSHLSAGPAPSSPPAAKSADRSTTTLVDVEALRRMGMK